MASITQSIIWRPDAGTAGITLASSTAGDLVRVDSIEVTREVQIVQGLRAEAGAAYNRRNQVGRRAFTVTYPPAASLEAARNAAETLEDNVRDFSAGTSILQWVFGTKTHTFATASLVSLSVRIDGLTVRASFVFAYGDKSTA